MVAENLAFTEIRSLECPSRSESPYLLRYLGPFLHEVRHDFTHKLEEPSKTLHDITILTLT